jgi:hypothetical protein
MDTSKISVRYPIERNQDLALDEKITKLAGRPPDASHPTYPGEGVQRHFVHKWFYRGDLAERDRLLNVFKKLPKACEVKDIPA